MKRIFIISKHPLFGEGIEELLRQESGFTILGHERDIAKAIEQVEILQPDIVVFDCNDDQLDVSSAVMQILQKGVKTKVIGLDLNTNTFYIHHREKYEIEQVSDLIKAFE